MTGEIRPQLKNRFEKLIIWEKQSSGEFQW